MLTSLRQHSQGWVAKTLLFLLAIAFATWGIESWIQGWRGGQFPITINGTGISGPQINSVFQQNLQFYREKLGFKGTPPDSLKNQILQMSVDEVITENLFSHFAQEHTLVLSKPQIQSLIVQEPAFQTKGKFSQSQYLMILQNLGLSEEAYIQQLQNNMAKQLMLQSLSTATVAPLSMARILTRYEVETRLVDVITIPFAEMSITGTPSDPELQEIYEKNRQTFTAPEVRDVALIRLTPKTIKGHAPGSEEAFDALYKLSLKLQDELAGGASFEDAARRVGTSVEHLKGIDADTPKGLSPALLSTALSLKVGEDSSLEEIGDSFQILRVEKIAGGTPKDFNSVHPSLIARWKTLHQEQLAAEAAATLSEKLAKGISLAEAARGTGYPVYPRQIFKREGTDLSAEVVETAYSLDEGKATFVKGEKAYYALKVAEIQTLYPESFEARTRQTLETLSKGLTTSLLDEFGAHLQSQYKIRVNQKRLNQLFGQGETP